MAIGLLSNVTGGGVDGSETGLEAIGSEVVDGDGAVDARETGLVAGVTFALNICVANSLDPSGLADACLGVVDGVVDGAVDARETGLVPGITFATDICVEDSLGSPVLVLGSVRTIASLTV